MNIKFGSSDKTEIIDAEGSTKTTTTNFRAKTVLKPIRYRYEIRHRTDKTDIESISRIAKALVDDFSKLDAEIRVERTKQGELEGTFNLIECYTVLSYE